MGPKGVVTVTPTSGAWVTLPLGGGATAVRFYLDFPEEAQRNDVTLPATRVFFSSACLESEAQLAEAGMQPEEALAGPGGIQLLTKGGLTIKRNDWRNGFGALGDVMLILGKFSISPAQAPA